MLRGMIFEADMPADVAAEFVTICLVLSPSTRGLFQFLPLAGLLARGSNAFFRLPGYLQWLDGQMAVLVEDFPLTVAGAAAGWTKNSSHRIPSKSLSGTIGSATIDEFIGRAIAFATLTGMCKRAYLAEIRSHPGNGKG